MTKTPAPAIGRSLWDLGRLAVALTARPMAGYLNRGRPSGTRIDAATIRAHAAAAPGTLTEAVPGLVYRGFAWLGLLIASVVAMVLTSMANAIAVGGKPTGTVAVILVVLSCVAIFSGMSLMLNTARWTTLRILEVFRYVGDVPVTRENRRQQKLPGALLWWLCRPSHVDTVVAVLWTLIFIPLVLESLQP